MDEAIDAQPGWEHIPVALAAVARRAGITAAELGAFRDDPANQDTDLPDFDDDDWDRILAPVPDQRGRVGERAHRIPYGRPIDRSARVVLTASEPAADPGGESIIEIRQHAVGRLDALRLRNAVPAAVPAAAVPAAAVPAAAVPAAAVPDPGDRDPRGVPRGDPGPSATHPSATHPSATHGGGGARHPHDAEPSRSIPDDQVVAAAVDGSSQRDPIRRGRDHRLVAQAPGHRRENQPRPEPVDAPARAPPARGTARHHASAPCGPTRPAVRPET